jgi:CheY-like chemotaxis protein
MEKKANIFYLEVDDIISKVIEWRLSKLGHNVCGSSKNGAQAIEKIQQLQPDVVLLDIELQGEMDGIEVGQFLETKTKIPFIYLTSRTEHDILQGVKKTGPDGFITKPFDDEGLRVAIELAIPD